jgi:DNA-binding response OmpR family regulator
MSRGQILFADNAPDFLDTRAEFLESSGYHVLKAYTLEQARQQLVDAHVRLAILDIRMVNDDDEKDTSGLTLAKDPLFRPVPKIILTNFPTFQAVREALGPALDGLPPAVDFLDKKEGPDAMIRAVEQAIEKYVRINWDLEIRWDAQERLSFLYLADLLQPRLPNEVVARRADELENLFRRLFYNYRQLRIARLFWHGSWRLCLSVLAQSVQGATDARVVVCGEREQLGQEIEGVQELAPETLQGVRLDDTSETMHFGAVAYTLPDADLETVRPLRALFQDGKERPLKAAFNHLLKETLPAWHRRGQIVADQGLMILYRRQVALEGNGLPRSETERRVDSLVQKARSLGAVEVEQSKNALVFRFPNQPALICPDPIATTYHCLERYGSATLCRISPGRLAAENILVDGSQRTWLTHFAYAGPMPQWWDYVCLEAMIRFDLGQAPDLLAWLDFEECLTQAAHLHDRLPAQDVISDLKTSIVLIEQIRRQACSETGPDLLPYEAGLLVWAVGTMAKYEPEGLYTREERMRGAHLLLAAGLLAQRVTQPLQATDEPAPASGPLRLDADGVQVWRGGQRIPDLGAQELVLFRCLYEHADQVVSRQELMEQIFGAGYVLSDPEGSLTALVRRLRIKIEPDPDHPRYLLTSRGKGYRLNLVDV